MGRREILLMVKQKINPNINDPIENLYIHVPYCHQKCGYCDYYSVVKSPDYDLFLSGIKKEWEMTKSYIQKHNNRLAPLKTLYFGGGTPSILPPKILKNIIVFFEQEIGFDPQIEMTLEVNPEPQGQETVVAGIESGINRISLGFQAQQDELLKKIGRIHLFQDFLEMLTLIRKNRLENISCDLMFALPDQTLADVLKSAQTLIDLDIPHVSFYSLDLEENTPFYKKYHQSPELLPSTAEEREMYYQLLKIFEKNTYHYYELSSVAKNNLYSRHNTNYWSTRPYLGLGPSAHSYFNGIRKGNIRSIKAWLDDPWQNAEFETIDLELAMREYAMLVFRQAKGFSVKEFENRFRIKNPFELELESLIKQKLIIQDQTENRYYLSKQGLDFANLVFMEFL